MRAYDLLLRLLPASFRSEYAEEMRAIFARRRRDARGPLALAWLWAEAVRDVASCAVRVHLDILRQDLRYVRRSLGRAPGFALTVVVVAALGVGATTAAFSITDHVLVRPLPFPAADRLVQLWQDQGSAPGSRVELSPANFRDWQRTSTVLRGDGRLPPRAATTWWAKASPSGSSPPTLTAEVIPLLGTRPLLGRAFTPEEDREGAPGTLLLSYGLWQERFAGDPGVLGPQAAARRRALPGDRRDAARLPLSAARDAAVAAAAARARRLRAARRPLAGVRRAAAAGRVARGGARGDAGSWRRSSSGSTRERTRTSARASWSCATRCRSSRALLLLALFGAALGVLLIACANLASLLLARALERRQELAVRTALGAGRERLLRQLLTESLLLATAGGLLGVLLALAALPLVARLVPNALPIAEAPPLDLRILAFAALMTLVTGVGFGLVPALRSLGDRGAASLREGARAGSSGRERLRSLLVVAEVTVSVVLLISSGLLIRALLRVQSIDPGFEPAGVLTLRTTLPMPKYQPLAARDGFYASVLGRGAGAAGRHERRLHELPADGDERRDLEDRGRGTRGAGRGRAHGEHALRHARLLRDARDPAPARGATWPRPTPRPACRWPS